MGSILFRRHRVSNSAKYASSRACGSVTTRKPSRKRRLGQSAVRQIPPAACPSRVHRRRVARDPGLLRLPVRRRARPIWQWATRGASCGSASAAPGGVGLTVLRIEGRDGSRCRAGAEHRPQTRVDAERIDRAVAQAPASSSRSRSRSGPGGSATVLADSSRRRTPEEFELRPPGAGSAPRSPRRLATAQAEGTHRGDGCTPFPVRATDVTQCSSSGRGVRPVAR